MHKSWIRFSIVALVLGVALPALAAEGRTPVFLDGTVLGADGKYILTRDIVSVSGVPVISIVAANVDLDLNGFTIFGAPGVTSIDIAPAAAGTDIKIHNGSIVGGDAGIIRHPGPLAERIVIEDMKLRDQTSDAIALFDTIETVHIRRTSIRRVNGFGIVIIGPGFTNGSIEHCSIKETGGSGILLDTVAAFEIAHNNLEIPATGAAGGHGIELIKAVGVLVNQNTISDPGGNGIELTDSKGNKIYNNVIRHAFTTGIHIGSDSDNNLILNNVASDCGFDLPPGHGLHVEAGQNQIHGNTLNGNYGCGMLFDVPSFGNTFGRNMARGNGLLGTCPAGCPLLFPPDSCDMSGAANDTSTENMIPGLF
jgi:parallel beta-helix repeat protein